MDIGPGTAGLPGSTITVPITAQNTGAAQVVDFWLEIILPDGSPYSGNPVRGPVTRSLGASANRARSIGFTIPSDLQPGWHTLRILNGTFPGTVDEIAGVRFRVL